MPSAKPVPRKWFSRIDEATSGLRLIAIWSRRAQNELASAPPALASALSLLREIETSAYKLALELSEIEIATHCDECPAAPAITSLQAHMLILAEELERQASIARQQIATKDH